MRQIFISTSKEASVPSSCKPMAGYAAVEQTMIGGGCAGFHTSVEMLQRSKRALDKR
jgi:hypothetical protein